MGQRYRFAYTENGDVLDPSQWIEDNNELASEFNGYLDRDNFGQATIVQAEITSNTFTKVEAFDSATVFTPDKTSITWQGGTGNNAFGIFQETVTCTVDCLLVSEVTLTWDWDNGGSWSLDNATVFPGGGGAGGGPVASGTPTALSTFATDTVQFRITVDGIEVCRTGLFDDTHQQYGTYLVGAIPVTAGTHIVAVECALNHRRWEGLAQVYANLYDVDIGTRYMLVTQEKR